MSVSVEDIGQRLQRRFRADASAELSRTYQFRIDGEDQLHLRIVEGTLSVHPGSHPAPCVTLLFPDLDIALGILEGRVDPMQAFLDGHIRSDGNLILALQLGGLFRP
ncbi:MAG: SCP2 sterol-binding domain-containing protein [Gammaproteobacteria bacterium]|nr:SCP2 sterol-binding domain-containing protein [Gammaproteobacteria bacterium]